MEVHEPYFLNDKHPREVLLNNLKTDKLDRHYVHKWRKNYPKEVKYVTRKIVEIIKILKERNLFDNSLIIVTSDHGQLLGEHGRINHGIFLYDELLKIPLLIKYPANTIIEIIQNKTKYVSLVKLKEFIIKLVQNKLEDDDILYSNTVFAESHGIHTDLTGKVYTEKEKKKLESFEKWKIAIYNEEFKGIFNVKDWRVEKIILYSSNKEVMEGAVKRLKKKVMRFLNTVITVKILKAKKRMNSSYHNFKQV